MPSFLQDAFMVHFRVLCFSHKKQVQSNRLCLNVYQ